MFTFIIGLFLWIAGAIISPIGIKKDADSSKDFQYHGLTEGNSKAQDKHGFFAYNKNLILSYLCCGIGLIAGVIAMLTVEKELAGVVMIIGGGLAAFFGGLRWRQAIKNIEAKKRKRKEQTEFLTRLKEHLSFEKPEMETVQLFNGMTAHTRNGQTRYELIGWIYSTKPDLQEAHFDLQSQIVELARKDPSTWFPK
jgi:hypothetical protein